MNTSTHKITPEWKVKFFPSGSSLIEKYLNEMAGDGWSVREIIYLHSSTCSDDARMFQPRVSIYLFRNRRDHLTLGDVKVAGVDK